MSVVGASGTGKTNLIFGLLYYPITYKQYGIFTPAFHHTVYFYKFWQPIYDDFILLANALQRKIQFEKIETRDDLDNAVKDLTLSNDKRLLIFDDSCEELLDSSAFLTIATAGRHKGLHAVYVKHNIYQKGKHSVTVDKNTSHNLLLKTPRIEKQLAVLGSELSNCDPQYLKSIYRMSTKKPFGHLLIDFSPTCPLQLQFSHRLVGCFLQKYHSYKEKKITLQQLLLTSHTEKCNQRDCVTAFFIKQSSSKPVKIDDCDSENPGCSPYFETFSQS